MRIYKCGCRTVPRHVTPPGVAFSSVDPNAAVKKGWVEAENQNDGEHWLKPCPKHAARALARWITQQI